MHNSAIDPRYLTPKPIPIRLISVECRLNFIDPSTGQLKPHRVSPADVATRASEANKVALTGAQNWSNAAAWSPSGVPGPQDSG